MKRGPMAMRVGGALIGLVGFLAFSYLLMPRTVELAVRLPAPASSLDLRVVDLDSGAEAYRGRRTRPEAGRSLLFKLRLSRGRYQVIGTDAQGKVYEAVLDHESDDFVEVGLQPR